MLDKTLQKFCIKKRWKFSDSGIAGFEQGYLVNIMNDYPTKGIINLAFIELEIHKKLLPVIKLEIDLLNQNRSNYYLSVDDNIFMVSFIKKKPLKKKLLSIFIQATIRRLKFYGIPSTKVCCECKKNKEFKLFYYSDSSLIYAFCKNCEKKLRENIEDEKNYYKNKNKNYIKGVLTSLLYNTPLLVLFSFITSYFLSSYFKFGIIFVLLILIYFLIEMAFVQVDVKQGKIFKYVKIFTYSILFIEYSLILNLFLNYKSLNWNLEGFVFLLKQIQIDEYNILLATFITAIFTLWLPSLFTKDVVADLLLAKDSEELYQNIFFSDGT